jgi:ubiquinone/menaquinone biosynthesis C-methylase UbiE
MDTQIRHPMLIRGKHDETTRQQFVHNLRLCLAADVMPGNREVYERRVKPAFKKKNKRDPKNRHEVRREMSQDPYYRLFCATQRASQEMMWDSVQDSVERELPELKARARANPYKTQGTLRIPKDFTVPRYHTAADIHLQPGGYHQTADGQDSIAAGALYDRSVFIYAIGGMGDMNDDLGKTLVGYYRENFAGQNPERVLDMGCSVGHSTLVWAQEFPDAEVHGLDCGEGMVRYAHARAQNLGIPAHFSQQNAEKTDFPDDYFDVVCSHIMLHETSATAFRNIIEESYRILKPGGVMMHLDLMRDEGMQPFDSFMMDWEAYNNNETFLVRLRDMDWKKVAVDAGFARNKCKIDSSMLHIAKEMIKAGQEPHYRAAFPILVGRK